jgi:hypothetical protein
LIKPKTLIIFVLLGGGAIALIATKVLMSQKPAVFQSLNKLGSVVEAQTLYQKDVKGKLTFAQAREKIAATILDSGGTKFHIYRFGMKETCGSLGCLHVAVNQKTKKEIPLQLVDLPAEQKMFKPTVHQNCFTVDQKPRYGAVKGYEICDTNAARGTTTN